MLGISTTLGHYNKSSNHNTHWRHAFDEKSKNIIAHVYKEDIDAFGYTFDNDIAASFKHTYIQT